MSAPSEPSQTLASDEIGLAPTRGLTAVGRLAAAALSWQGLDLLLPWEFPGAGAVQAAAFEALGEAARAAEDSPPWLVAMPAGVLLVSALAPGRAGRLGRGVLGAAAAVGLLAMVGLGALMERAAFLAGGAAAVGLAWAPGPLAAPGSNADSAPPGRWRSRLASGVALVLGLAGALWVRELLAARSEGYETLLLLAELGGPALRSGGIGLAVLAGLACLAWTRSPRLLVAAVLVLPLRPALDPLGPWASALGLSVAVAAAAGGTARRWSLREPSRWPAALLPLAAVGALAVGHAYAVRVFGCLAEPPHPAMTRVAAPRDVFRFALGDGFGLLAFRAENRIGRLQLSDGSLSWVDPAGLPRPEPIDLLPPGASYATPEELVGAQSGHWATVLGNDPNYYSAAESPSNAVRNQLVEVAADGRSLRRVLSPEGLCWVGALAWTDGLWAGCEYEPTLHRLGPDGQPTQSLTDPRLGDVAALAPDGDGVWSTSFWHGRRVARVHRGLQGLQADVLATFGGGNYDIVMAGERVLVSSYYRSEVGVLDRQGRLLGRWPTGLGARALAFDPLSGFALASSVYDGAIRVCGPGVAVALPVGGHVKDIAVKDGVAWFASRCGIFRLDLGELAGRPASSSFCPAPLR